MNEWGYSYHFIDAETEAQRGETLQPWSVSEGVSKPGSKPNLLSLSAATAQASPCLPHPGNQTEATGHRIYQAEVKWEGEAEMFPQDKFEEIKLVHRIHLYKLCWKANLGQLMPQLVFKLKARNEV